MSDVMMKSGKRSQRVKGRETAVGKPFTRQFIFLAVLTASMMLFIGTPESQALVTKESFKQATGRFDATIGSNNRAALAGNLTDHITLQITDIGPGYRDVQGEALGDPDRTFYAVVILCRNPNQSGNLMPIFCIDIRHDCGIGDYYESAGPTPCQLTWLLNHYPPDNSLSALEASARQIAVWRLTDDFVLTDARQDLRNRVDEIMAQIPNPCSLPQNPPSISLIPAFPIGSLPSDQHISYTVYAEQDGGPSSNLRIQVATDFGALDYNEVYTNAQGYATFSVTDTSGQPGVAHVTAQAAVVLPRGTIFLSLSRVDPSPGQKLVLGEPTLSTVYADSSCTWINPNSIIAHKFIDYNMNGVQETNEPCKSGWTIFLTDFFGQPVASKVTDADGNAVFTNLPEGIYTLTENLPAEWKNSLPISQSVTLEADTAASVIFGNIKLPAVKINKFHDLNYNGIRNPLEMDLDGWEFILYDGPTHSIYAHGVTEEGSLVFSAIPVNSYLLRETMQPGWLCTTGIETALNLGPEDFIELNVGNNEIPTPTPTPTLSPTATVTPTPTLSPTWSPTATSTLTPTETLSPTLTPTDSPTLTPTETWSPTLTPTDSPTMSPTSTPTDSPTLSPTLTPTDSPTFTPTDTETLTPTESPTLTPTDTPTFTPTDSPTLTPTDTLTPTLSPTLTPTASSTDSPTASPSATKTLTPTLSPTDTPTWTTTLTPTNTQTASPTATLSPTVTNTATFSPTRTPTNSPTPTPFPVGIPTQLAEVVIAGSNPPSVDVYMIASHAGKDYRAGEWMATRTLLSEDTDPPINGVPIIVIPVDIFCLSDNYSDVIVLTSGADPNGPNLFVFRNDNRYPDSHGGLNYSIQDAIRAGDELKALYPVEKWLIEPVTVRAYNANFTGMGYEQMEIAVAFNVTNRDPANPQHKGIIVTYKRDDKAEIAPDQWRFSSDTITENYREFPNCKIIDFESDNFDYSPALTLRAAHDDLVVLTQQDNPTQPSVYILIGNHTALGWAKTYSFALPYNEVPTSVDTGDLLVYAADQSKIPNSYPEVAIGSANGYAFIYQNNINRKGYLSTPFTLNTTFNYLSRRVRNVYLSDIYTPSGVSDLFVTIDAKGTTPATIYGYLTSKLGVISAIPDGCFDQVAAKPSLVVGGMVTEPEKIMNLLVVDSQPNEMGYCANMYLHLDTCGNPAGNMSFDFTRERRRIAYSSTIVSAAFTQNSQLVSNPEL